MRATLSLVLAVLHGCGGDDGSEAQCVLQETTPPTPRGELTGVLTLQGVLHVYGGNEAAPESCMPRYAITSESWVFNPTCRSWHMAAFDDPGVRARHAAALDSTRARMVIFGGRRQDASGTGWVNLNDVWSYDLSAEETVDPWMEITPSGTAPSPRSSATAVYDAGRDRLLVFGGNTSTSGLTLTGTDDLYTLDLGTGTWTAIEAAGGPSARLFHAAAVVGDEMVLYGGTPSFDGPFLDDAYAFDLTHDTWRLVSSGGPGARFGHGLVAAAGGRVVMMAGHDATELGNRNDVWSLDVAEGTWTMLRPGDTFNAPAGGLCDFPADFTIPELDSPERRYAFVAVSDGASDGYILGGKTDCGNVDDVWHLDLATGSWSVASPTVDGESCLRSGRTDCTSLCF